MRNIILDYPLNISWGYGSPTEVVPFGVFPPANHTYSTAGWYNVSIDGNITSFNFYRPGGDRDKIVDIVMEMAS